MKEIFRVSNIIILLIVLFFPTKLEAQKTWSLESCINYAMENNIAIQQQSLNVDLKEADNLQSKANLLPTLNAGANHVYNWGQTIDRYTNSFASQRVRSNNFYITSQVILFNGFQLLNRMQQSQYDIYASVYDLDKTKDDISLSIATAYLQILYNGDYLEATRNQLEITKKQLERTRILVESGTLAKGDLLNMESQAANDDYSVIEADNNLNISYLTLTQLLELSGTEDFVIEKPDVKIPESESVMVSPEKVFETAQSNQPDIKSAEFKLRSSEKALSIARGTRSPQISLQATYGSGYSGASTELGDTLSVGSMPYGATASGEIVYIPSVNFEYNSIPFDDQLRSNENKSLGFYLTIPIFNGFSSKTSIAKAKIAVKSSELNLQSIKNNLRKNILQAHADAKAALKRYAAAEKSVAAMEESFKYMSKKFDLGMVNSVEYSDVNNKLIKAKSDLLQAKYEYIFRIKILDFYQGKPLKF